MIYTACLLSIVGESFEVRFAVVVSFPNSGQASNAQWTQANDIGSSKVINVRGHPSSIVELKEMIACFVITSDEDSQVRCGSSPAVILVKVGHFPVFLRHRGYVQIMLISYGLEDMS